MVEAECSLWQVLPLHPPGRHGSPYDSPSSAALDTRLIDLDALVADGVLLRSEVGTPPRGGNEIAPEALDEWHRPRLERAATAVARNAADEVAAFADAHPWVQEWARFTALTSTHRSTGWWGFAAPFRDRRETAMSALDRAHQDAIQREIAAQLLVHRQWQRIREAATERGIVIIGDLPMFVARDGVDTWIRREHFRLQPDGRPHPTTGAPPDAFSAMGQVWNNPHYAWDVHAQSGFTWWIDRFRLAMARFDFVRLDHFRGLVAAWAIPARDPPDARQGAWVPAPGAALLDALRQAVPRCAVIAEDLGHITPEVTALRRDAGWPGMKVLQFAFDGAPDNVHLPPFPDPACVIYTGTHDNNTAMGWYEATDAATRSRLATQTFTEIPCPDPAGALIRVAWNSEADWAIAPMQDVLRLGDFARMNTPGQTAGNWMWRAQGLPATAAAELATLAQETNRMPGAASDDEEV
jgi:4-alpha-glucanotransferase